MRKVLIWTVSVIVLASAGAFWLTAKPIRGLATPTRAISMQIATTPVVAIPIATPNLITINTPASVTVTTEIVDSSVIPNGVNLLRLNTNGTWSILGVMHDDGINGDITANDKTFSLRLNLNEATAGPIQVRVSAAFKGRLQRVLSSSGSISVWQVYQNNQLGFRLNLPATFTPSPSTDPVSKQVVFFRSPGTENDILLIIKISALPSSLSLIQAIEAGGVDAASINQLNIGGHQYFKWFSLGQGDGNWSYATLISNDQVISVSTPSAAIASSPEFVQMVASLTF
jgi:hypothetical protein